jgi:uncharacterized protein YaeQ
VIVVSLDVRGAFDATWLPNLLVNLREFRCPKNLYDLTKNYFSDRVATLHANTHSEEKSDERLSIRFLLWPWFLEHHV